MRIKGFMQVAFISWEFDYEASQRWNEEPRKFLSLIDDKSETGLKLLRDQLRNLIAVISGPLEICPGMLHFFVRECNTLWT